MSPAFQPPGADAVDRPFTRAMRADGRPATLDDYVAAGGYEALRRAVSGLGPKRSPPWWSRRRCPATSPHW